jgi:prevent-host-death family protein
MRQVASRELRNRTRAVLEDVEAGEEVIITVDGRAVASLRSTAGSRPRFLGRSTFIRSILSHPADTGLRAELREIAPDTTDDLPRR